MFCLFLIISGNISQAVYQCDECSKDICSECYDLHKKSIKTGKHKMIKIDKGKRNRQKTNKAREICDNHAGQFVECYCPVHKQLLCRVCVSTSHKQCSGVETIEAASNRIRGKSDVTSLSEGVDKLIGRFEKILGEKQAKLDNIKQQGRHLESEILKFQEAIIRWLDKTVKIMLADKSKLCEKESKELEHNITTCTNVLPVLVKVKDRLSSTVKSASENDIFITVCRLNDEVNTYDVIARKVEETSKAVKFDFEANKTLSALSKTNDGVGNINVAFHDLDISKFESKKHLKAKTPIANGMINGPVIRKTSASTQNSALKAAPGRKASRASSVVTSLRPTPLPTLPPLPVEQTGKKSKAKVGPSLVPFTKLNVSMKSDKFSCFISSMTYLPNGRLCVIDSRNSKIKMYGSDRKLLSSLNTSGMPHDITRISENEVAVTLPASQKVLIIKVEKKLKLTKTIKLQRECYGIAFNEKNGKLYIGLGKDIDACVEVYNVDGSLLKTIKAKNAVLNFPQYMAFNNTWTKLYVSDQDSGIVVVNLNDRGVVNQPSLPDVERYQGIAGDKDGNLYVITNKPDALQKIHPSARGLDLKLKLVDGPPPLAVTYGAKGGILIVSFTGSNLLQLYQFA